MTISMTDKKWQKKIMHNNTQQKKTTDNNYWDPSPGSRCSRLIGTAERGIWADGDEQGVQASQGYTAIESWIHIIHCM